MRELHTVKLWYRSPGSRHYAWLLPQALSRTLPAAAWTGPWTGAASNPSAASAFSAMSRVIRAARAHAARDRTYGKEKVYGSIP